MEKKGDYQNALVCGLISAMDLAQPSGNYNIAFNDATKKIDEETEKKMGKFANIPGLF